MKWRVKGTTNPVGILQMVPRISMIAELDTEGQIYLSLTVKLKFKNYGYIF